MANLNDTYASLLSAYSGSVNDKRSELLASILGYTKALSLNDMEKSVLTSLGYTGALNDAWDKYIRDLGGLGFSAKSDYLSSTFYGFYGSSGSLRNLLTYTEEFAAINWARINSAVTVNAAQSPSSTMTAAKLVATAATGEHYIAQGVTVVASTAHTFSCYMKAAEENVGVVWQNVLGGTLFNLTTGAVISGVAGSSITAAGNGWYRCSVPYTPSSTDGLVRIYPRQSTSYTGDGTSGILIWGAQLELGSTATAYQKVVA
jgi:hypothetical protein